MLPPQRAAAQASAIVVPDNVRKCKTKVEKYMTRPSTFENESLFNFCKKYDVDSSKFSKKTKENIVRVFPKLSLNFNDAVDEKYYKQKVILHVPWRNLNDLKSTDTSWKSLYISYNVEQLESDVVDSREMDNCHDSDDDDMDNETSNDTKPENLEEAMIVCRLGPNRLPLTVNLGLRESDLNFKWSEEALKFTSTNSLNQLENFIKIKKEEFRNNPPKSRTFDPIAYPLGTDQQAVLKQVKNQVQCILEDNESGDMIPQISIVQGKAGTGKSHLINYLRWYAEDMLNTQNCVLVLGPTGVSALNIGGDTAIYRVPDEPGLAEQGKALICNVRKVFFLKQCFRQKDPTFQGILDRISTGDTTREDYALLSTRFLDKDSVEFKNAVRFFATKKKVQDFNEDKLQKLKLIGSNELAPVVKIVARHNNNVASRGTTDQAQGLHQTIFLGKTCRVMLTSNLWTEMGLVNGAKGEVTNILYEDGQEPPVGVLKACVDIGDNESHIGSTYVALSRVKTLEGLLLKSFPYERLANLKSKMKERLAFESFLETLSTES
ncbi:ATP-dependent DNA helicase [Frankliniella fusca]|uniref:ATP-dependent DNA helicase n=1 Tax=Frankliniella fusca TaxID=407009 RepID=A0AAE1L627_9NEOP|nr:ATP-dependent DNA helicase [Frankliniella fusca]